MDPHITQALQLLDRHLKGATAARDDLMKLIAQGKEPDRKRPE